MKRAALSLLGGVVIPFCYAVTAGPLSTYVSDPRLQTLLLVPVRWPALLLERFLFTPLLRMGETTFLLIIVFGNIVAYSIMTYIILWAVSLRRRPATFDRPPPPPPRFTG